MSDFPESVKTAINGLAWQLLLQNPEAHKALRDGNMKVAKHYIEQAKKFIETVSGEYREFETRGPLDSLINSLGPKSDHHQRTLQSLRRQPAPRPQVRHAQIRDQVIDEIFGRGASKR